MNWQLGGNNKKPGEMDARVYYSLEKGSMYIQYRLPNTKALSFLSHGLLLSKALHLARAPAV